MSLQAYIDEANYVEDLENNKKSQNENWVLDQYEIQSNIDYGTYDDDYGETTIPYQAREISEKLNAHIALESMVNSIYDQYKKGGLNRSNIEMMNMSLSSHLDRLGVKNKRTLNISLENDTFDQTVTLFKNKINEGYSAIVKKLDSLTEYIIDALRQFNRNLYRLKTRLKMIRETLPEHKLKQPKYKFIKPESWCYNLCYSKTGFIKDLKTVPQTLTNLLDNHKEMSKKITSTYVGFLKDNLETFSTDSAGNIEDGFRLLGYNNHDFLLDGMGLFSRSVRLEEPMDGFSYYRTPELPGGKALYCHASNYNDTGEDAINSLYHTNYFLDEYDPTSFKLTKMKIAIAINAPISVYLAFVNPFASIAHAGAVGTLLYNQKVKGTGETGVKLTKDMMLDCLSRDEINNVLTEIDKLILSLSKWDLEIFQKTWKDSGIDNIIDQISGNEHSSPVLKKYCSALLNLLANISTGIHNYIFRVANATLNYVEKSLCQYK